ncbi:MAG: S8 family serine peptidase [Deltaproteobacteria bacterium]|nr:S8 family serine peptidase [Deltaproteobacteria bacterium]
MRRPDGAVRRVTGDAARSVGSAFLNFGPSTAVRGPRYAAHAPTPAARRATALAAIAFAFTGAFAALAVAEEAPPCGPFEAGETRIVQLAADRTLRDPGVQATGAADGSSAQGSIVPLPGSLAEEPGTADESEALLALPKNAAGGIPTDFELGPDAKIAQSFFSPVICATVARVTGPPGSTLDELVTVVPETGLVVPNDVYASAAAEVVPAPAAPTVADPYAPLQYGLAVSGVRAARSLGAGEGVRIALLDSAPEVAHRDLAPSRIEALATDPKNASKKKPAVHGTLMAGVIGAAEDNGFGIAGLAPRARIVSIPVCTAKSGAGGQCTIYEMLQGFDRAYDAKAVLVNLSLSGPPNPLLERGVARLEALGLVVVAAAGNEGRSDKRYPAAYPSVIGVGAVDRDGKRFATSNHGRWVELYAPGVEVLSTVPGNAFAFGSGTSLAAAHVTGSLAVLTGITGDVRRARSELFRTVNARTSGGLPLLPAACDVLGRAGRACKAPKR